VGSETRVEAAEVAHGTFVVTAGGPFADGAAGRLRDTLFPLAAADGAEVLLDLDHAYGVDAAAFDVIASAARLAQRRGHRLRIVTRDRALRSRITGCGLGEFVDLSLTLGEAIDVA
jgi:anti-anti-sigma factor